MIIEKTMYTVQCDSCGEQSGEDTPVCAWEQQWYAEAEAINEFGWIKHEDKHYCPKCAEDETELVPINYP